MTLNEVVDEAFQQVLNSKDVFKRICNEYFLDHKHNFVSVDPTPLFCRENWTICNLMEEFSKEELQHLTVKDVLLDGENELIMLFRRQGYETVEEDLSVIGVAVEFDDDLKIVSFRINTM